MQLANWLQNRDLLPIYPSCLTLHAWSQGKHYDCWECNVMLSYHFYKYQGKGKKIVPLLLLITSISVTFMIYTYSIELYSTYLFHIIPSLLTLTSEIKHHIFYKIITKHFMQKFVILEDFCWLKVVIIIWTFNCTAIPGMSNA